MWKKTISLLLTLVMLISLCIPQISVFAADSGIKVQLYNGTREASANTISPKFKILNTTGSAIDLSKLKLRYYYTVDSEKQQSFWCDHSGMMSGWNYIDVTSKVTSSFVKMGAVQGADTYLEVGFASNAGELVAGSSIEVQTRFARNDWSNYDQANDYSFNSSASTYVDWDKVTAYLDGALVWGTAPNGDVPPTPTPTPTVTPTPTPTPVVTPTPTPIPGEGLIAEIGTAIGQTGETVTVPVTFKDVAKVSSVGTCNFYVNYDASLLEAASVTAGDIVTNAGVNFSSSISNGTISFLFLDNTIGSELIAKDGVFATISFKIKGTANAVVPVTFKAGGAFGDGAMKKITKVAFVNGSVTIKNGDIPTPTPTVTPTPTPIVTPTPTPIPGEGLIAEIGTVIGQTGETVKVPVTFKDVAKVSSVGTCNFYVNYDASLLEAASVTAGDIVTNAGVNFSSSISNGTISFLFLDNTIGSELIAKDGLFATISFKIKGTANAVVPVTFKAGGAFGDGAMKKIAKVSFINGSVTIKNGDIPTPTPVVTPTPTPVVTPTPTPVVTPTPTPVVTPTPTPVVTGFSAVIGTATGKAGEVVTVPVTFNDVAKAGNVGTCNVYVNYDASLLEATSVKAGDIITNAGVNFSSSINNGTISLLFLDNTIGSELISKDGVFATITFKVKGTASAITPVTFKVGGAFGDGNMKKISNVKLVDGSVTIIAGDIPTPTPVVTPTPTPVVTPTPTPVVTPTPTPVVTPTPTPVVTPTPTPTPVAGFNAAIGTATGKAGDTITIPVSFNNIAKVGSVGTCNVYVNYDATLLEAASVKAGDIITNAGVNFSSSINNGTISLLFLDNTIGSELISKDGVFATITFKVKGTASATTPVTFKTGGAFGDGSFKKIADTVYTNGSVIITK